MGSRLKEHTKDKPKCLVSLGGKPLLEHQLEALRTITDDIVVVRGYMKHLIDHPGIRYYDNEDYENTNMVGSLMTARSEFDGECLVCYSDIVYEPRILRSIQDTRSSVGIAVDTDFKEYWEARLGNLNDDNESLQINKDGNIIELGTPDPHPNEIHGRYLGLLKFDKNGTDAFKRVFDMHAQKNKGKNEPWYNSKSFDLAYMTDMIQAMIDDGVQIDSIQNERGWLEMDTDDDYRLYHEWIRQGIMHRFCKLF